MTSFGDVEPRSPSEPSTGAIGLPSLRSSITSPRAALNRERIRVEVEWFSPALTSHAVVPGVRSPQEPSGSRCAAWSTVRPSRYR